MAVRSAHPTATYGFNGQYVKSLDGHWSAGVRGNWNASSFNNQDWAWSARPGNRVGLLSVFRIDAPDPDLQLLAEYARLELS